MAREKGTGLVGGFDGVADPLKPNVNINNNDNKAVNNKSTFNKVEDPLEKLRNELPSKQLTTVMKGIYFDSEVSRVIDEQAERLGRGGKSRIVNDVLKNYFIQKGLL